MKSFLYSIFVTPFLRMADWYGKNFVGETIDIDLDDIPYFEDTLPPIGQRGEDSPIYGPPTGSKEWEEWIDNYPKKI